MRYRFLTNYFFQAAGTFKRERIIVGRQGIHIKVEKQPKLLLNFCANNYLGIAHCTFSCRTGDHFMVVFQV